MSSCWLMWITVLSQCQEDCRPSQCSTSLRWLTWFHVLSFSITLLGLPSEHCWEIPLRWTADKWHTSSCYLVEIPQHISPRRAMCSWIYVLPPKTLGLESMAGKITGACWHTMPLQPKLCADVYNETLNLPAVCVKISLIRMTTSLKFCS